MRILLPIVLLASILTGCDSNRIYEYNKEFPARSWKVKDSVSFEFIILDPSKKYNVYYNIRNSLDYPYARLFVNYSLSDSLGLVLPRKLASAFLFDQKTGRPMGSSGLGDVYDHQFPLLKGYEFKRPGRYSLKLEQFMRTDSLKGVLAVGVRVEEEGKR